LEFFLKHPLERKEDEHDPPPDTVFGGCVFSNFRNFSDRVEVAAEEVGADVTMTKQSPT
jgi:hypothetical protein